MMAFGIIKLIKCLVYVKDKCLASIVSVFLLLAVRRVHITEATLKHLNKAYEVEEGNGHLRDLYLKELNVQTYLVIDPRVSSLTIIITH